MLMKPEAASDQVGEQLLAARLRPIAVVPVQELLELQKTPCDLPGSR